MMDKTLLFIVSVMATIMVREICLVGQKYE